MYKISKLNLVTFIILTIIAVIYVLPNFTNKNPTFTFMPQDKINLGLDLQGGSHLLLNVNFDSYFNDVITSTSDALRYNLRRAKIGYRNLRINKKTITFDMRAEQDIQKISKIINSIDHNLSYDNDNQTITVYYNDNAMQKINEQVIDQSIEVIRMRVDSTGTTEPIIQRQGQYNILLQVPGEQNPSGLKKLLGKTAKLTFHLVDNKTNLERAKDGHTPSGSKLLKFDNDIGFIVIKNKILLSGEQLNNAQAQYQDGMPVVHFAFSNLGAKKFADITNNNIGRRLAIVLDQRVISAPVINSPILGGDGVISGNFTIDTANELSLMLRAGALPAPLDIIEERTIGPNLGADSIESGKMAAMVGFLLIVCFMILTYGVLGLFANITLSLALLYILALLSMLQATLTLPGIAGIILTIGMAVDANVLIYERIREELRKNVSNLYAVKVGFDAALGTIVDSNITTLIAAFLLYIFGVGAIKGFAVTLTIGILTSMYSALVITKLMIDLWLKYAKPKKILY